MEKIVVHGTNRLSGSLEVQGSKNSALPILAACAMTHGTTVLHNCPMLTDVRAAIEILRFLGCRVETDGCDVTVDTVGICAREIPACLMHAMRSSIIFMGALLSRFGRAALSSPGGCEIGARPIDLHIASLRRLGVQIREEQGQILCKAGRRLHGTRIHLAFPSVGATENILLAAVTAQGMTTIVNAAREPEIVDLAAFLNACGAKIFGAGEGTVTVVGTERLDHTEFTVMPDRIVAATYLAGAAVTGGEICVRGVVPRDMAPVLPVFEEMGCYVGIGTDSVTLSAPRRLRHFGLVQTLPYPGFPTDAQANIMAMAATADGVSVIEETIFESRYKHAAQLVRMGADIQTQGRTAVIRQCQQLKEAKQKNAQKHRLKFVDNTT